MDPWQGLVGSHKIERTVFTHTYDSQNSNCWSKNLPWTSGSSMIPVDSLTFSQKLDNWGPLILQTFTNPELEVITKSKNHPTLIVILMYLHDLFSKIRYKWNDNKSYNNYIKSLSKVTLISFFFWVLGCKNTHL